MRYILVIGVFLIVLGLGLTYVMRDKGPEPLLITPPPTSIPERLTNPHGNVIVIAFEGLRPDRMSAYGYENSTTPRIDNLAGASMVFERCYAQSTGSYRNFATILTSQYPHPSTSRENVGKGFRELLLIQGSSIVEQVREGGLTTTAFVANPLLRADYGFGEGFDYYDDKPITDEDAVLRPRSTEEIYNAAENWIRRNSTRPFFLFIQFPDPSGPYNAETQFERQLKDLPVYREPKTLKIAENEIRPLNALPSYHGTPGDERAVGEMRRLYDAEVAKVDHYTGEILDTLSHLGIDTKTMVILTSMHGEAQGEHGHYFSYGGPTYNCLTHIPLIIYNPNGGIGRIKDVVEGIDIMPTALGFLGIEPKYQIDGMNLLRYGTRQTLNRDYPAFSSWDDPKVVSVVKGKYELINFDDKEYKLYNIVNDPSEIYDLYSPDNAVAKELMRYMDFWIRVNREKALESEMLIKYGPKGLKNPMITPSEQILQKP